MLSLPKHLADVSAVALAKAEGAFFDLDNTPFRLGPDQHKRVAILGKKPQTTDMVEDRLTDVESTIAFQEKTIGELSDVICRQHEEIDLLKAQVENIIERMAHDEEETLPSEALPTLEHPPHY